MRKYIILKSISVLLKCEVKMISFIVILLVSSFKLYSQDEPLRTYMKFSYLKKTDGSKHLKASLSFKENKKFVHHQGGEVIFYRGEEFDEKIETVITDPKGEADLMLPDDVEADSVGVFYFSARFKGDDKLKRASKSLSFRDAHIELSFNQKSDGRTIDVIAYEMVDEEKIEISEQEITISVPTLFGDMVLGKGGLEEGTCQIGFPEDLPGDSLGNLEIIAMINDSEEFGNVEKREEIPWGVQIVSTELEKSGAKGKLWTYNAPLWMVITLIILMTGVWSHFGYVIYKMYKINKEGASK